MENNAHLLGLLQKMKPITLEEMSGIRLMNRTDTKFVTNKAQLAKLLEMAQDKYYAQFLNGSFIADYMTTYWDTQDYNFYLDHHNGRAPRQKVRVRTYMDSGVTFLEVKTKNNHGRTKKKRVEVPCQEITPENGNEEFLQKLVQKGFEEMRPTVQNRFHPNTLVNYGKTERLTIDFDVKFHNFDSQDKADTGDLVIIELKRDGNVFSPVLEMLRELRIKPSGFSKYCFGCLMTKKGLKKNLFKKKFVRVRRLTKVTIKPL